MTLSSNMLPFLVFFVLFLCQSTLAARHLTNRLDAERVYCDTPGQCTRCLPKDSRTAYCSATGFKQLLLCTISPSTDEQKYEVVVELPLPVDAALMQMGDGRVVVARSCDPSMSESESKAGADSDRDHAAQGDEAASGDDADDGSSKRASFALSHARGKAEDESEEGQAAAAPFGSGASSRLAADGGSQRQVQQVHSAVLAPGWRHMSVFHFELFMLAGLAAALPVVYWRKTRIRHL